MTAPPPSLARPRPSRRRSVEDGQHEVSHAGGAGLHRQPPIAVAAPAGPRGRLRGRSLHGCDPQRRRPRGRRPLPVHRSRRRDDAWRSRSTSSRTWPPRRARSTMTACRCTRSWANSLGMYRLLDAAERSARGSVHVDLGGLRRPARPSPTGDVLGQRPSCRPALLLRRSEAIRRGAPLRVPA